MTPYHSDTTPATALARVTALAEAHALRDREESERIRALGAMVAHDLNNALFALSGRLQLLRRKATDPTLGKSLDELQATARLFESQLQLLHEACPRDAWTDAWTDAGDQPALGARATVERLISDGFQSCGVELLDADPRSLGAAIPPDATIRCSAQALAAAVRQLLSIHRARGARSVRCSCAIEDAAGKGGDLARLAISFADASGRVLEPMLAPSLLAGSFSLEAIAVAAATRAIRDDGASVSAEPAGNGLRTTLFIPVRRGIPLAQTGRHGRGAGEHGLDDACENSGLDAVPARSILVADDDPAVRALLVAALESVGDDVEASDDPSCIARRDDLGRFDAIVLDAGGGGVEALRGLRAKGVGIPVLLASGAPVEDPPGGATRVIQKPFPLDRLDRELAVLCKPAP